MHVHEVYDPETNAYGIHLHWTHFHETPAHGCTLLRCTPVRYTLVSCTFMRYTPIRCTPMKNIPTVGGLLDRHEMSKDPIALGTLGPYSAVEELGLDLDALGLAASLA